MKRQKPTQRQVIRHPQDANVNYTKQSQPNDCYGESDNESFRYPSLFDPIAAAPSDANETAENSENLQDFDLRAAIIYSEILKPKFDEK